MLLRAVDGAVRPRRGGRRLENVLLLPGRPERGTALPGCSLCQHGRSLSSWASRAWGWTAGAGAGPRLCPQRRSATRSRRCAGKWPRECRPCRWVQPQPNAMAAPPSRAVGAGRGAAGLRGCGPLEGPGLAGAEGSGGPGWAGARAGSRGRRRAAGPEAGPALSSGPEPRVPAPTPRQARPERRQTASPLGRLSTGPSARKQRDLGGQGARIPGPGRVVTASPPPAQAHLARTWRGLQAARGSLLGCVHTGVPPRVYTVASLMEIV